MFVEWDDSLSIDHAEIDRDHKHLFMMTNRVIAAGKVGSPKEDILKLLCEYIDYVAIHYSHEEVLMVKIKYPDTELHIRAHGSFFNRLSELIKTYEKGEPDIHCRIAAYIGTYAFNHIETYDRKLANFCQQRIRIPLAPEQDTNNGAQRPQ